MGTVQRNILRELQTPELGQESIAGMELPQMAVNEGTNVEGVPVLKRFQVITLLKNGVSLPSR